MGLSIWSLLLCVLFLSIITYSETQFIQKIKNKIRKVVSGDGQKRYDYEEMMLFPNIGFQLKDGRWRLNVHGWRFKSSKRNKFLGKSSSTVAERIARLLATSEQIVYYNDTFQRDRLKPFMVQDKQYEEIFVMIGEKYNDTTQTDSEGQFRTSFILPNDDVQELKQTLKNDQVITYQAVGDNGDLWTGEIYLLDRRGLSIISDIDDTIKVSEVLDKIRLVANTFIHGFRVVKGMPEVYQAWKDKYNCTFHYLSAMPDQLYAVTKEFIDDHKFPNGTFHMRHFRWSSVSIYNFVHSAGKFDIDLVAQLLHIDCSLDTKMHKINHLRYFIFNSVRTLVLVGDSGERDPEIYGFIARKYPKRVHQIFIRAVKGESKDDKRFLKAFEDVPKEKWLIFTDPTNELPKDLNITAPVQKL